MLKLSPSVENGAVVVSIPTNRLTDEKEIRQVRQELYEIAHRHKQKVLRVDCEQITLMNSDAIGEIVDLADMLSRHGMGVELVELQELVYQTLTALRIDSLIALAPAKKPPVKADPSQDSGIRESNTIRLQSTLTCERLKMRRSDGEFRPILRETVLTLTKDQAINLARVLLGATAAWETFSVTLKRRRNSQGGAYIVGVTPDSGTAND